MSALIYLGLLAVPAHRLFAVTTGLITLLAAGLAAQAVFFLQQADYFQGLATPLWDTSWLLQRRQHAGPPAAHADRLHRDAGWRAVARLCDGDRLDAGVDAAGRAAGLTHLPPAGAFVSLSRAIRRAGGQCLKLARAAVLRQTGTPMAIETVEVGPVAPGDVLVRIRAASLCHTDLEAIEGALAVKLPAVLGHEAAGEIAEVGADVTELAVGDRVVLSWNPHCGRCFYCERAQPILCSQFLANGPQGVSFRWPAAAGVRRRADASVDVSRRVSPNTAWCRRRARSACRTTMPFDRAALLGCGVMTGVGAATRIADLRWGAVAMVIGCGAVGLSAVQGCRLAGRGRDHRGRSQSGAAATGAGVGCDACGGAERGDAVELARSLTDGRGADVVIEAAGGRRVSACRSRRCGPAVRWFGWARPA